LQITYKQILGYIYYVKHYFSWQGLSTIPLQPPPVPQSWATVHINSPPDDSAVVGRKFVMTCKMITVRGLAPTVIWTGPDGKLTDTKNITVGPAQTFGLETSQSLTLHYLQSSEGGLYTCKAVINIPRLNTCLQASAYKQLIVISM